MFGWVKDKPEKDEPRAAYAGRVRLSHATGIPETLSPMPAITLAILGSPKPTTTRFYLMPMSGRPADGLDEDQAGYDGPNRLRGRKFYRHQTRANLDKESPRAGGKQDDQNRTIHGALDIGSTFAFTVEFENLEEVELGALLWSLEIEGLKHRIGFAKPLGFGSASIQITEIQIVNLRTRYRGFESDGWSDQLMRKARWIQRFKDEMKNLYGQAFDQLANVRDLRALLGEPPGNLPIHYPRSTEKPTAEGKNFEWFMGNKRGLKMGLPLTEDDRSGLPLLEREGTPRAT
jgi:CRISPR-associated protein (TIGR03986 family)